MHPLLEELHEGFVEVIQGAGHCFTGPLPKGIGGQICKGKQEYVKKYDQCQRYAPNIHQPEGVLNPLSSPWPFACGGWTLWSPSLRQHEIESGCWLALTTSPNGLKLSPCQISEIWTPRGLYGKILSRGLRSLIPSSRTMGFSLIAKLSEGTVVNWVSRIGTRLRPIHKRTNRPRLSIKS